MWLRLLALVGFAAITTPAYADADNYEAVVKLRDGSTSHVTERGRSYYEVRDRIERIYCGGEHSSTCIVEGPWRLPK